MALRERGGHNYGDSHSDIRDELRRYSSQNGTPATRFINALCPCGAETFHVRLDDDAGAAVRVCQSCGAEHAIGDSAEYLAEAMLEECECPCAGASFEMSVGVALYAGSTDVKWLYLGLRCVHCGLVACYGDGKNEYPDYEDLLRRV